jgi:hypothetical protein
LRAESARLLRLLKLTRVEATPPGALPGRDFRGITGPVHAGSPADAKVAFFSALFAARTDISAVRWENALTREGWVASYGAGRVAQGNSAWQGGIIFR